MSANQLKDFLKIAFEHTIEDVHATEADIAKYFSKDYVQYTDGVKLTYDDFIAHMKAQKEAMTSIKVTFKHMVAENNQVATVHIIDGVKKDGGTIQGQVNALFMIKDNKLIYCNELTHLIKGSKKDKDLGSRK